jgi:hypothetical protein
VDVFGIGRLEAAVNNLADQLQELTTRVATLNSTVDSGLSDTRNLINSTNYETRRQLNDAITRLHRPEPQPNPATGHEPDADEKHERHLEALVAAARITNVRLICHRDLWAFLVQNVAHAPHFRVPDKVKALDNGRIRVALSGPSLIAALTVLRGHQSDRTPDEELGNWAQALVLYNALTAALCDLEDGARPEDDQHIDIILDLRNPTPDDADASDGQQPQDDSDDGELNE